MPARSFPSFRTLDLNLLRVFDEVMAERSLTRAARNLSLTQPAVSNALRRLRDALGDELVHRAGQGVEPTARALALWPSVRQALRQLQTVIAPSSFVAARPAAPLCWPWRTPPPPSSHRDWPLTPRLRRRRIPPWLAYSSGSGVRRTPGTRVCTQPGRARTRETGRR